MWWKLFSEELYEGNLLWPVPSIHRMSQNTHYCTRIFSANTTNQRASHKHSFMFGSDRENNFLHLILPTESVHSTLYLLVSFRTVQKARSMILGFPHRHLRLAFHSKVSRSCLPIRLRSKATRFWCVWCSHGCFGRDQVRPTDWKGVSGWRSVYHSRLLLLWPVWLQRIFLRVFLPPQTVTFHVVERIVTTSNKYNICMLQEVLSSFLCGFGLVYPGWNPEISCSVRVRGKASCLRLTLVRERQNLWLRNLNNAFSLDRLFQRT